MTAFLRAIGRSAGHKFLIDELKQMEEASGEVIDKLKRDGFGYFYVNEGGIMQIATEALLDTLSKCEISAEEIDAIIMGTNNYRDVEGKLQVDDMNVYNGCEHLIYCALQAGIVHAYPFTVGMSDCANSITALVIAEKFVSSGLYSNVAVVLTDRLAPGAKRIKGSGLGVCSDIAVSFIVSSLQKVEYKINMVTTHAYLQLLDRENAATRNPMYFMRMLNRFKAKLDRLTGGLDKNDLIIMDNISGEMIDIVCMALQIDREKTSCCSKFTVGHAFSADWLLSLSQLQAQGQLQRGAKVGVISLGEVVIACAELEVV